MVPAESFAPPRWLRPAHLQTSLSSLPPRRWNTAWRARALRRVAQPWVLELGSHGRLRALVSVPTGVASPGVAVLLHGWEGHADSPYVLSVGAALFARGHTVVRLTLRDHGGTHGLTRELFHSCRLEEVVAAVAQIAARFDPAPVRLAGFSLGGNFFLRVAASDGLPRNLRRVVAISPVLHPETAMRALESQRLYHGYFVRRWSRSLRAKQRSWPADFDFAQLLRLRDLRAMTDALVREHTDFASMQAYLDGYAITGPRLARLGVPAHLLCSLDDPIIPAGDLARIATSPKLEITATAQGGHCGFIDRLYGPSFADRYVLRRFSSDDGSADSSLA